jgi:hypothetical protein
MENSPRQYAERVEEQMREWTNRISELKTQADRAPAEKKIGMLNQIALLNERKDRLLAMVEELRRAPDEDWDRLKRAAEKEVADIDENYREALAFFH